MEAVDYYLEEARSGNGEGAFFALLELPDDPIPSLIEAFRIDPDPSMRSLIVEIIWQRRQPSSISFLADALSDPHPEVWKRALDGLVTMRIPEVRRALETSIAGSAGLDSERRAWISEAIGQMESTEGDDPRGRTG